MRGIGIAVAAVLAGAAAAQGNAPRFRDAALPPAEVERLHASLAPRGERWEEIPWQTGLTAARRRAASEGKPILMWIMDGHPLGCT